MYYSTQDLLEMHGVNLLTGEADKYSMRILCDLNASGVETICTFFGINPATGTFNENWNSQVHGQDAIASFMLPRGTIPELCKFCAFHYMNTYVFCESGNGYDLYSKEEHHKIQKFIDNGRSVYHNYNYRADRAPASDRNTHQMSGRTV